MKPEKRPLSRALPARLLLCAFLPMLLVTALAVALPYREMLGQRYEECAHVMQLNVSRIGEHLGHVSQATTLLQDSEPLRQELKKYAASTASSLTPRDLYLTVGTPISYRNLFSNRAISAITLYSNRRLAFYGLQQTTTDLALTRCGTVLLNNTREIPEGGLYVLPQTPNGYIYYINDFTDIYDGRKLGHMVIEIESVPTYLANEQFGFPFDYQVDLSAYPGAQYLVYGTDGTVFFSSDAQYIGTNLTRSLPPELVTGTGIVKEAPGYTIYQDTLYKEHLFLSIIIPNGSITDGLGRTMWYFLGAVLATAAAALTCILLLSQHMAAPLKALEQYCITTRGHVETPPAFDPGYREIGAAKDALAARGEQVKDMQSVIMKNQLKMKDNEIQLLQSQINPHFLFNMLDIIGWQAAKDQNQDVSDMVNHLGGLLRNNILLNNEERITIGQEVQYIRDYLALEQIRHAGRFTYSIEADEDLLSSCYIPKLSLQPIVENCIVHGFQGLAREGVIEIRIWDDLDDILCTVKDNGTGFDAEGYFERATALPPDPKRSHIALHNIQDRIHMLCGPQYGIKIESVPGKGTAVTVTLPLDEKGT